MQDKNIFEELQKEETFKTSKGLPANEHAKKLAKADSAKKAKKPKYKEFFTIKNGKYLHVIVKENGLYSSYVGKDKRLTQEQKKQYISQWEKEGIWVPEHKADDFFSEEIKKLAGK